MKSKPLPQAEIDHAVGQLILDSNVDSNAVSGPAGSVEDGLRRLETAALAQQTDAVTSLRAVFHTGLSKQGNNAKLAPDGALEACWRAVEARAATVESCIALRRGQ